MSDTAYRTARRETRTHRLTISSKRLNGSGQYFGTELVLTEWWEGNFRNGICRKVETIYFQSGVPQWRRRPTSVCGHHDNAGLVSNTAADPELQSVSITIRHWEEHSVISKTPGFGFKIKKVGIVLKAKFASQLHREHKFKEDETTLLQIVSDQLTTAD